MSINNELNQSNDGDLTPDQLNRLLAGEDYEGDTEAQATETGGQPEASSGDDEGEPKNEAELSADNALVMARDNKHTIPFEKLEEAREGQKHWRAQAEAAQQELEALKAAARERADSGQAPTKQDNQIAVAEAAIDAGVDPELFGDFSEEALAAGVKQLVRQGIEEALAPMRQQTASNAHYDAILAAHPDAESVYQSAELSEWIGSQPTFVRNALTAVLQEGSTGQVIELFDAFKSATGTTQAAGSLTENSVMAAAKQKAANAKSDVPASLSDFPAGRAGTGSRSEAMQEMAGIELLDAMDSMTQQQIEDFLNRTV